MRVMNCSRDGFWVQALTFQQGPALFLRGSRYFLSVGSQQPIVNILIISTAMNNQKDSVVNFLTPTKLITGALKSKPRPHPSDSLFSLASNKHKPNEQSSKNYNSQLEKFNYGFNRSQEEVEVAESRQKYSTHLNKNYEVDGGLRSEDKGGLRREEKGGLRSEDNFGMRAGDRVQMRSENLHQSSFVLHPVQIQKQVQPYPFIKLIQDSAVEEVPFNINPAKQTPLKTSTAKQQSLQASLVQQNSLRISTAKQNGLKNFKQVKESRQYLVEPEKGREAYANFSQSTQGLNQLITQLRSVKYQIETSLTQLQDILDNTSKFLNNIQDEYSRIKQRILDYTSQVLDAGFSRYRQNMVSWAKYEEVEMKSKLMLQQLEKTVKEDELMVEQMNKLSKNSRMALTKQTQLSQKIQLYSNFLLQLNGSKLQCLNMRPQLKRDKILAYEESLATLADF